MATSTNSNDGAVSDSPPSVEQILSDAEQGATRLAKTIESLGKQLQTAKGQLRSLTASLSEAKALATAEPEEPAQSELPSSAGARLLATQLMVNGSSRDEVEKRLREDFEIEHTDEILGDIFGAEPKTA